MNIVCWLGLILNETVKNWLSMKAFYYPKPTLDYDLAAYLYGFDKIGYTCTPMTSSFQAQEKDVLVGDTNQVGKLYPSLYKMEDFPPELQKFYKRSITLKTWKECLNAKSGKHFFKPKRKGVFTPFVSDLPLVSHLDMYGYLHVSERADVWVQDPLTFMSEFRVFVYEGVIQDVRPYSGDPFLIPEKWFVENAVQTFNKEYPYIIDVGITKEQGQVVIEVNNGCCFGTYGLDPLIAAKMYRDFFKFLQKESSY